MKIHVEQRKLAVEGALESKTAGIRATATMMAALAGLYSDPKLAIVREYMTNMLDGYTRLRRLRPHAAIWLPVVHLPNSVEPYIEFKDFGIGMDYDEVWNVFTDFGGSTKQESNDEVGGLGLGAKTAFTYSGSDVWYIESRYDGEMHIIHATKDEQGIPKFFRMASIPTDEPNGVTVRVPVKPGDFADFRSRVAQMMTYFPMDVKIIGDDGFTFKKPTYVLEGTDWGLRNEKGSYGRVSHVIMGNIAYPLDARQFDTYAALRGTDLREFSLDLRLPVGEVDITPSREGLMYTDRTLTRVAKAVKAFLTEVRAKAEEGIKAAETEWEALKLLHDSWGTYALRKHLTGIKWRGKDLDPNVGIVRETKDLLAKLPAGAEITLESTEGRRSGFGTSVPEKIILRPEQEQIWVYLNDLGRGARTRIRYHMEEAVFGESGYRRRRRRYSYTNAFAVVFTGEGITVEQISKALGGFPVGKVTDLPAPPKPERAQGGKRAPVSVKLLSGSYWYDGQVDTEAETVYYVRLERNDPMNHPLVGHVSTYDVSKIVTGAVDLGLLDASVPIYGLPRTLAKYEKAEGWVEVLSYLYPRLKPELDQSAADVATLAAWSETLNLTLVEWLMEEKLPRGLDPVLTDFLTEARRIEDSRERSQAAQVLATRLKLTFPEKQAVSDGKTMLQAVYRRYPMLEAIGALAEHTYAGQLKLQSKVLVQYLRSA